MTSEGATQQQTAGGEGEADQQKSHRQVDRHHLVIRATRCCYVDHIEDHSAHQQHGAGPARDQECAGAEQHGTDRGGQHHHRRRHDELVIFENNQIGEASGVTGQCKQDPTELRSNSTP